MSQAFDSVLVANRGEIAVRVLRSAAAAGYRTIAVYSEADAGAPHVAMADEAVLIGPAPVKESYLDPERILEAASRSGAQAIHPGYGFLSENAAFARACERAGLVFIGPSAEAIDLMGNKAAAKRRMLDAKVPCIRGYQGEDQAEETLFRAASEIGFPIMVKAAAGGGGRGMRLVHGPDELPAAIEAARSEATNAFGSDELILEKAVLRPRHVEVQVFGDGHGNVIHLGERDCSVQRRHQKVVEEAPCPVMTPELRAAIGEAAVAAARSIDYVGAGTVEFLLDGDGAFYFLEMNTRLQVEHPVTELVTGLDLVDLQLRVARGEALPIAHDDVALRGHAIEARLYAEDTVNGFLPASGRAATWMPPAGEGVRVDHGLKPGLEVSPFYDPMIAKIIASGGDRSTARRRLVKALRETVIFGLDTNRQFLIDVLQRQSFALGQATTAFIDEEFPDGVSAPTPSTVDFALAGLLQSIESQADSLHRRVRNDTLFTGAAAHPSTYAYGQSEERHDVHVQALGDDRYEITVAGSRYLARIVDVSPGGRLRVAMDGHQCTVVYATPERGAISFQWRGKDFTLVNELAFSAAERTGVASGSVLAPMHGNLLEIRVAVGDAVKVGDELAIMEAMKMEHRLTAAIDGQVRAIHGAEGGQIAAGALVLEIAPAEAAARDGE